MDSSNQPVMKALQPGSLRPLHQPLGSLLVVTSAGKKAILPGGVLQSATMKGTLGLWALRTMTTQFLVDTGAAVSLLSKKVTALHGEIKLEEGDQQKLLGIQGSPLEICGAAKVLITLSHEDFNEKVLVAKSIIKQKLFWVKISLLLYWSDSSLPRMRHHSVIGCMNRRWTGCVCEHNVGFEAQGPC